MIFFTKLLVIDPSEKHNNILDGHAQPESTKQMEQTLRAKVKIFFKSENLALSLPIIIDFPL